MSLQNHILLMPRWCDCLDFSISDQPGLCHLKEMNRVSRHFCKIVWKRFLWISLEEMCLELFRKKRKIYYMAMCWFLIFNLILSCFIECTEKLSLYFFLTYLKTFHPFLKNVIHEKCAYGRGSAMCHSRLSCYL